MHSTVVLPFCVGVLLAACTALHAEDWTVPPKAAATANPIQDENGARKEGRSLYNADCAYCHGPEGKGDGPSGIYLNPKPGDFALPTLWSESDGSLFWKITNGRNAMPSFRTTLKEDQRWKLILFLRTFAPKPAATTADAAGKP